jgi:hypothetical protein
VSGALRWPRGQSRLGRVQAPALPPSRLNMNTRYRTSLTSQLNATTTWEVIFDRARELPCPGVDVGVGDVAVGPLQTGLVDRRSARPDHIDARCNTRLHRQELSAPDATRRGRAAAMPSTLPSMEQAWWPAGPFASCLKRNNPAAEATQTVSLLPTPRRRGGQAAIAGRPGIDYLSRRIASSMRPAVR